MNLRKTALFASASLAFAVIFLLAGCGAAALSLLHGAAAVGCFLDRGTVAAATVVAVLLFTAGPVIVVQYIHKRGLRAEVFAGACVAFLVWTFALRPAVSPAPLAGMLPEGTAYFVSVDALNAVRGLGGVGDAIGRDKVRALLYPGARAEKAAPRGAVDYLISWAGREVVVAGRDAFYGGGKVLLIGIRDRGAAGRDFPEFAKLVYGGARGGFKRAGVEGGVEIRCAREESSGYCWALTERAVVVSDSEEYLRQIVSESKKPRVGNRFSRAYSRGDSGGRAVYAYLDGRFAADLFSSFAKRKREFRNAADALRDIEGAEYSLWAGGSGIRQRGEVIDNGVKLNSSGRGRLLYGNDGRSFEKDVLALLDGLSAGGRMFWYERKGDEVRLSFPDGQVASLAFRGGAMGAGADDADAKKMLDSGDAVAGMLRFVYSPELLRRAVAANATETQDKKATTKGRFTANANRIALSVIDSLTPGVVKLDTRGTGIEVEWLQGWREEGLRKFDLGGALALSSEYEAMKAESSTMCIDAMWKLYRAHNAYWVDGGDMGNVWSGRGALCEYLTGRNGGAAGCRGAVVEFVSRGCGGGWFTKQVLDFIESGGWNGLSAPGPQRRKL